jgi:ectoine hydroxylase-related dioxygenase (phytanoyl-CoA dioxygenase family)
MTVTQHDRDLYCLRSAGYLILHDWLSETDIVPIERASVAFEDEAQRFGRVQKLELSHNWPLLTTRCLYAISRELQDAVMHPRLQALVHDYLGGGVLRDSLMQTNMPDPRNQARGTDGDVSYHRDTLWPDGEIYPHYLHMFLLLSDLTLENGATTVVPGTHRQREPGYYFKDTDPRTPQAGIDYRVYERGYFPSAIHLLARRGSVIMLDPMTIHSQGINVSDAPRRLINTTFRSSRVVGRPPLLNAAAIARRAARVAMREDFVALLDDNAALPARYGPLDVEQAAA